MAMMISRFHKLIQSKVLWLIFLGVIVVSFVGFFTPGTRSSSTQGKETPAGELFGKKVSQQEFRTAYSHTYIWAVLTAGRMIDVTQEMASALREQAWQRLAAIHTAVDAGIVVTDDEVVRQIQQMPLFCNENGVFESARYKGILQNIGLVPKQVEDLFREQLAISKLMYRHTQAALISPYELEKAYHLYTDRFVLDYLVISRDQVADSVSVSREDAEALYAENPEPFRMPAKVRVSYVELPVSGFMDQAEVTEEEALQFYSRNMENYRIASTNATAEVEYTPFEEVQGDITKTLAEAQARRAAAARASELVAEIAPKAEGEQPDFKGVVTAAGLKIKTLPAFGPSETLEGIDMTAPFRQAAFALQADPYSSFSDAVVGRDSVYLLSLEQHYESFIPPFDAVEADVMAAARKQAVSTAVADRALKVADQLKEAVASGTSFADAAASLGLSYETTEEFDLSTGFDNPYSDTMLRLCLNKEQGEFCGPGAVEDGALIAYVAERKTTDMDLGLPAVRDELIAGLTRNRERQLISAWQESLLADAQAE